MAYVTQTTQKKKTSIKSVLTFLVLISAVSVGGKLYHDHQVKQQEEAMAAAKKAAEEKQLAELKAKRESDDKTYHELLSIMTQWSDAVTLANKTPRVNLAIPIQEMQKTRRLALDFKPNECSSEAKDDLVENMDIIIDIFLSFASQKTPDSNQLKYANSLFDKATKTLSSCMKQ